MKKMFWKKIFCFVLKKSTYLLNYPHILYSFFFSFLFFSFSFFSFSAESLKKVSLDASAILARLKRDTSEDQLSYNLETIYEKEYDQLDIVFARWFTWGIRIVIFIAILLISLMCFCACLKYPCLLICSQLKSRCYFAILDRLKGLDVKYQRLRRGLEDMDVYLDYETYLSISKLCYKTKEKKKDDSSQISYQRLEP